MMLLLTLFFGTFLAEDATALAAGVLVSRGQVNPLAAVTATGLGIFAGDMLLWLTGRLAADRLVSWKWTRERITRERLRLLADLFNRRAPVLMLTSRARPASRLPLYLAAGAAGGTLARFTLWSAIGVALWTPALVLAASTGFVIAAALCAVLVFRGPLGRASRRVISSRSAARLRAKAAAAISRAWRWEFWPTWLFYPPAALWTLWLSVRFRGFGAISAANPGIADGGIVGESKFEILRRLPAEWVVPSVLIDRADVEARVETLGRQMALGGWAFPLVLKPDVGQRGVGVRIIRSMQQARAYLHAEAGAVLAQPFHDGPYEAGIFYYRKPSWAHGLILSITDKQFPVLTGDGTSTLEDLIWAHPRYRMQARRFLRRHDAMRRHVLGRGERFVLARAGNHAQGTMFLDGSQLVTPALESRIDAIARAYPGFFIGRFDVRYRDTESFKAGRDLAIVELNGATAEATDIYDPSRSLWSAYRMLFRQWKLVFEIGAENRARGAAVSSPRRLAALVAAHLSSKPAHALSD